MSPKFNFAIDSAAADRKLKQAVAKRKRMAKERVYEAGDVFENEAIQEAPVDTYELQESISKERRVTPKGPEVHVGAEAEHAAFQEFGTVNHDAQPFIRPALAQAVSYLRRRVR